LAIVTLIFSLLIERYSVETRFPRLNKIILGATVVVSVIRGAQIVFCIGVGTIQAFVVSLLTSMYLSAEIGSSGGAH